MRLPCPFCGLRDEAEFTYEGDASAVWPALDAPEADWVEAVYMRDQPRGPTRELWRHAFGCRSFVAIERDNVTHEVFGAALVHPGMAAALAEPTAGHAPAGDAAATWTRPPVAVRGPARGAGSADAPERAAPPRPEPAPGAAAERPPAPARMAARGGGGGAS